MTEVIRTDITDQVRGQVKEGKVILVLDGKEIGSFPLDPAHLKMDQGYTIDAQLIYKQPEDHTPNPRQYVNCSSEAGWC
jgi:hypothetical protein